MENNNLENTNENSDLNNINLDSTLFNKVKEELEIKIIVQSNGKNNKQLSISIPADFIDFLRIKNGDLFRFTIIDNGEYSIRFCNIDVSKSNYLNKVKYFSRLLPEIEKDIFNEFKKQDEQFVQLTNSKEYDFGIGNKLVKFFLRKVIVNGRHFVLNIPKEFIDFFKIERGDIFKYNLYKDGSYSIKFVKKASENFNENVSEQNPATNKSKKLKFLNNIDKAIIIAIKDIIRGVTASEIADTIKVHPSTVMKRLDELEKMSLVSGRKIRVRTKYTLNKEKYNELFSEETNN